MSLRRLDQGSGAESTRRSRRARGSRSTASLSWSGSIERRHADRATRGRAAARPARLRRPRPAHGLRRRRVADERGRAPLQGGDSRPRTCSRPGVGRWTEPRDRPARADGPPPPPPDGGRGVGDRRRAVRRPGRDRERGVGRLAAGGARRRWRATEPTPIPPAASSSDAPRRNGSPSPRPRRTPAPIGDALAARLRGRRIDPDGIALEVEPGRALFADAGSTSRPFTT